MDAIKQVVSDVTNSAQQQTGQAGAHPGPDEFKGADHSQRDEGRKVGIQADMAKDVKTTDVEAEDGFDSYKPAGKMIDRKCLVTGGDSGIGRAAAVMFAMEGADVAINYLPEEQVDANQVQKTIQALGRQCLLVPQDLRDMEGCKRVVETVVKAWGRIDVLVNNASVMYDCPDITDISDEQFHHTIDLNIKGTFFLTRAAVPHMGKGSSIIVTASQVAYAGPPSLLDYTMTKAAQVGMVRSLSNQLISKGIRVNAVCPGPVWTPLQPAAMDKETMEGWHNTP